MSFFNDFIKSIEIDDMGNKIYCSIVFDCGIKITANFKIETLQENEIVLKCKKTRIKVLGENLSIASFSKGEIEISGNVNGVIKL